MPPRLAHTKSRTGCLRCKKRRVKCDEHRPACNGCKRHNVRCQWPGSISEHTQLKASPHVSPPRVQHSIEDYLSHDQRRQLELQLLHYFSNSIVWTLGSANNSPGREVWTYTAVELSFKYPFLQNAIYAFAALYLLKTTPNSRAFFAPPGEQQMASRAINRDMPLDCPLPLSTIHQIYLDVALRGQRNAVVGMTSESANAVYLSTLLHWYQAAPQFSPELQQDGYHPPLRWLRMAQANKDMAQLSRKLMPDKHVLSQITGDEGPDWDDHEALYGYQNCKPFEALLDWDTFPEPEPFSPEMQKLYELLLAYVGSIYKALQDREHLRRIFRRLICLGVMLPVGVIGLVEEGRPRALAILAHYFAMAYALNDHWVWNGLAEQQVDGLESILPKEWLWAMEWPRKMLQELKNKPYSGEHDATFLSKECEF